MVEIGCGNCYYSYFDERAYPCSICIRGIERTDQWKPSIETQDGFYDEYYRDHEEFYEPQTEREGI